MRFQRKLFLSFLLLSFSPAALLIVVFYSITGSSLDRWVNVNVLDSLEDGMSAIRKIGEDFDFRLRTALQDSLRYSSLPADLAAGRRIRSAETLDVWREMLQVNYLTAFLPGGTVVVSSDSLFPAGAFTDSLRESTFSALHQTAFGRPSGGQITYFSDRGILYSVFSLGDPDREGGCLVAAALLSSSIGRAAGNLTNTMVMYRKMEFLKEAGKKALLGFILLMALFLVCLSIFVSRNLSREISRPLNNLARAAEKVGGGDFDVHIDPKGGSGEIAQLVEAFNRMTLELKDIREKLLEAERIAAWRESARRMSHELKNPLTPLCLSLTRLRKRIGAFQTEEKVVEECLDAMEREVKNLVVISDQFSRFARMPAPRKTCCSPRMIAEDVARLYLAGYPGITWVNRCGGETLSADREQIHRLLSNLMKNAFEAMEGDGTITVSSEIVGEGTVFREAGGKVPEGSEFSRIVVEDTGPGIAGENLRSIFKPYFSTKTRGTGLGLAIVQQIVLDHGGLIVARNRSRGGAAFAVYLPQS